MEPILYGVGITFFWSALLFVVKRQPARTA